MGATAIHIREAISHARRNMETARELGKQEAFALKVMAAAMEELDNNPIDIIWQSW